MRKFIPPDPTLVPIAKDRPKALSAAEDEERCDLWIIMNNITDNFSITPPSSTFGRLLSRWRHLEKRYAWTNTD